jgi:tetratricopeptide (TPR) repeat protein
MRLSSVAHRLFLIAGLVVGTDVRAADFVPSGPPALERMLGRDALDDVDHSEVARAVERDGFWAGEPIGVSQCAGCHADAAAQWSSSAHRYASFNNPYYTAAVEQFRRERGAVASRFCGGCHDPALVSSGRIDGPIDRRTREAQAGIVCLVCHSIADHPPRDGNGHFLARLDPWPVRGPGHGARLRPATLATVDLCGSCHRVGLTPEITQGRWLRGQDELYPWLLSSVSGHGAPAVHRATQTQRCQDCHMPLEPAPLGDAAAHLGADGVRRIRSHRFLGANMALAHLRGDAATEARVAAFLRDRVELDLQLVKDAVDVVLRSRGVGHRFPGGTMDSNEVWIALRAFDKDGRLLGESGRLRPSTNGAPELGREAHLVRAQMVDGDGAPLRFRDVQHARGVVYDSALAPGDPQAVRYALPRGTAQVEAHLYYRKFSSEYARFACAEIPDPFRRRICREPPVVELARATIDPPAVPPTWAERCATLPWERVLDHGLALAGALADRAGEAEPWLRCAAEREPRRVEPLLGLARLALALGRTDEVVALTAEAERLVPSHPAAPYLATTALLKAYRHAPARRQAERLAALLPDDPTALMLLARARGLDRDSSGALEAATRLLVLDPENEEAHYQRALALGELGRKEEAQQEENAYLAHRTAVEENLALRAGFRRWHRQLHDESEPLHQHALVLPLGERQAVAPAARTDRSPADGAVVTSPPHADR